MTTSWGRALEIVIALPRGAASATPAVHADLAARDAARRDVKVILSGERCRRAVRGYPPYLATSVRHGGSGCHGCWRQSPPPAAVASLAASTGEDDRSEDTMLKQFHLGKPSDSGWGHLMWLWLRWQSNPE